jgi:hypothetical protein
VRPVPADRPDPAARPVPADRPDVIDVRLQSMARERKKSEEALREMGFGHEEEERNSTGKERTMGFKKKKTGKEKKRKKKENRKRKKKNVTDGFF